MRNIAYICSILVIFTIPWEDAFTIGPFGSVTRIIGLLSAAIWLSFILVSGKFRKPQWFHLLVFLFILWNIASLFWSVSIEESSRQIKTYIQLGILAYLFWDLISTSKALITALQVWIFGEYITIVSTVINYINGQQISQYSGERFAGAGVNAVDLALTLALGLPIAWHLTIMPDNKFKKPLLMWINYAYIPAALFAMILTGSRTSIFVAIPALVYIVRTLNRIKPIMRLVVFFLLLGSLFVLQFYIPQSVIMRLATAASSISTGDLGGRVNLWKHSIAIFKENPVLGIGSGALRSPTELGAVAHNTFLSILTELGLIGFVIFMALLGVVVAQALLQTKEETILWLTVLAIWSLGVFSLTWEYRKTTWLILSLVIINASLLRQQSKVHKTLGPYSSLTLSHSLRDEG